MMHAPELARLLADPATDAAVESAKAQVVAKWARALDVAERERLWSLYHGIDAAMTALRAHADAGVIEAKRETR